MKLDTAGVVPRFQLQNRTQQAVALVQAPHCARRCHTANLYQRVIVMIATNHVWLAGSPLRNDKCRTLSAYEGNRRCANSGVVGPL